ncbi:hypothetical protein CERSUDRAFT_115665, partial [Gelatoporia subvermispora B]
MYLGLAGESTLSPTLCHTSPRTQRTIVLSLVSLNQQHHRHHGGVEPTEHRGVPCTQRQLTYEQGVVGEAASGSGTAESMLGVNALSISELRGQLR